MFKYWLYVINSHQKCTHRFWYISMKTIFLNCQKVVTIGHKLKLKITYFFSLRYQLARHRCYNLIKPIKFHLTKLPLSLDPSVWNFLSLDLHSIKISSFDN